MKYHVWVPINGRGHEVDFNDCPDVWAHPHVQRMNSRQQLTLAQIRYPDAQHARLGHCIGAGYLASVLGTQVGCSAEEVLALKIAGTTHDIGHGAACHVIESLTKLYGIAHEDKTLEKLEDMRGAIGKYCDYDIVRSILAGKSPLTPLVASIVGGDKIDYITRDRYHCGLPTSIDAGKLYSGASLEGHQRLLVFNDRALELTTVLREWWSAHTDIYLHKDVEIPRAMFRRAANFHHETTGWDFHEIYDMLDSDLEALLRTSPSASARALQRNVDHGAPYKEYGELRHDVLENGHPVIITPLQPGEFTLRHAIMLERELTSETGLPPHSVVVTVSDGLDRLNAKSKARSIYVSSEDGAPETFASRHPEVVSDLEREARDHFALRVIVLPQYWDKATQTLPPLSVINERAQWLARANI